MMNNKQPQIMSVGQPLYYVPRHRYGGEKRFLKVTKLGRKWATCGEGHNAIRIDRITLEVDGGEYSSPGDCYLSKEIYDKQVALDVAWEKLRILLGNRYRRPQNLTLEEIKTVTSIMEKAA